MGQTRDPTTGQLFDGGAARVAAQNWYPSPSTTYTANFIVMEGGKVVLPADAPVLAAAEIPYITAAQVPVNSRRINLTSSGSPGEAATGGDSSNLLGWAVVLNAATSADAETAFKAGLDTNAELLGLAQQITATSGDNNIILVPLMGEENMEAPYDITTVHVVPIGLAVDAIGSAFLSVTLMPAPTAT